jgi:hypothetical protein
MIASQTTQFRPWRPILLLILLASLVLAPAAFAADVARLVFFGDSLSDPGNYFIAFGTVSRAPFEPIPDAPYAIGGHHFRWSTKRRAGRRSPAPARGTSGPARAVDETEGHPYSSRAKPVTQGPRPGGAVSKRSLRVICAGLALFAAACAPPVTQVPTQLTPGTGKSFRLVREAEADISTGDMRYIGSATTP